MTETEKTLRGYVENGEIAGACLLVRKSGEMVFDGSFGCADTNRKIPVTEKTIFPLASMSKPVCAIAVMQLVESGKLGLYDEIAEYIPAFSDMRVCSRFVGMNEYEPDPDDPQGEKASKAFLDAMTYVPALRKITVFDLLTHSSGLGMGPVGNTLADEAASASDSIQERAVKYASIPLDFQPGTHTGYSAVAGFEVLSAIVEIVSGESYDDYLSNHIFSPMKIRDMGYTLSREQKERVSRLYEYTEGKELADVSDSCIFWNKVSPLKVSHHSAGAGMLGSMEEYEKIAHMLLDGGRYEEVQILKPETVRRMGGEGIPSSLQMAPGLYWGLGMIVFQNPELLKSGRSKGSFGWSGAFGTHFDVDPKEKLEFVLGVSRSNIGGAGSYVSSAIEWTVRRDWIG